MSMLNTDKRQIDCGGNAARNVSVREKSRADVLLDYLFPPSCVCCGTLIPPDVDQDCFCESCYERLQRASVPHFRRIEIGDRRVAVLTAMSFSTAPDCPSRALILSMKNVRTSRSAYFFGTAPEHNAYAAARRGYRDSLCTAQPQRTAAVRL